MNLQDLVHQEWDFVGPMLALAIVTVAAVAVIAVVAKIFYTIQTKIKYIQIKSLKKDVFSVYKNVITLRCLFFVKLSLSMFDAWHFM